MMLEYRDCMTESNTPPLLRSVGTTILYVSASMRRAYSGAALVAIVLLACASVVVTPVYAQSDASLLERGEQLFMENRPEEAAPVLEAALQSNPTEERAYLYLGIVYEQLGLNERAIEVLRRGRTYATRNPHLFPFNIANNFVALDDPESAEESYNAAIDARPSFPDAYLNRANLQVDQQAYEEAISDYRNYLTFAPNTPHRDSVERMIEALQSEIEAQQIREEQERIAREEAERQARIEEERRQQEEAERRRQEEARRQALLNSVLDSLNTATNDAQSSRADRENPQDYEDTLDIDNE